MVNSMSESPNVVFVDAGSLMDPSRALDAAKDLARALGRPVNLRTLVCEHEITYAITLISSIQANVTNVMIAKQLNDISEFMLRK
jgi:hypothetical protein